MQGPGKVWGKDVGEGGRGWRMLEGQKCRGRGRGKDRDANGSALLTIQGELEGTVNAPRNLAIRLLQPLLVPTPPKTNIGLARSTHAP